MLTWHTLIDFCYVTSSKNGVYGTPEVRKANQGIRLHLEGIKSERLMIQLWVSHKQTSDSVVKLKVQKTHLCFNFFFILSN